MASTVIGAGITIEGEVTSDEDVVVQGTVRGKLVAKDAVSVEQGGAVEADIAGGPVAVAGTVTGNITSSDRVDLQNGAKVIGNVKATRITIADGAQFKGNVDMDV
ncbi:MAG: polymer-forming cytoskeletal protein [Labilithrix sp.]|nr:polymer-forming cytoskeletal protein [Labilithrix sp.]MBX3222772.1 polymer-forming cytoskeletal protein [Labilithrix sp.]